MDWLYVDGGRVKDITGQKFNHLTAIRYSHKGKWNRAYWVFRCDCGNEKIISSNTVTKKNAEVKSCGCVNDAVRKSGNNHRIHGDANTRLYKVWKNMRRRCYGSDASSNKWYKDRGIKICEEWNDYRLFRLWALANGYDENAEFMQCTLDRIDTNGDYCPENCRWVSCKVQANNKTNNRLVEWNGDIHTLSEWSDIVGIPFNIIASRYYSYGWTIEDALSVPVGVRRKDWR
jgi:hypothetical protein